MTSSTTNGTIDWTDIPGAWLAGYTDGFDTLSSDDIDALLDRTGAPPEHALAAYAVEANGGTAPTIADHIAANAPTAPPAPANPAQGQGGGAPKQSAATILVALAKQLYTFGTTTEKEPYALPVGNEPQIPRMVAGRGALRNELAAAYYKASGVAPGQQSLVDALAVLHGETLSLEPTRLHMRVAEHDGAYYLDMGDDTGRSIRIAREGWVVVDDAPILFRRTALTAPLTEPDRAGTLHDLWGILNVTPEDRPLLAAWLVAALIPEIAHPVILLTGGQGTGKSTAAKIVGGIIDASTVPLRKPPKDIETWVSAATGSWVVNVDNISKITETFSDSLCRAVTGDGDVKRTLYTDNDLSVFSFRRAVILNGIDVGDVRGDLSERLLAVDLHKITERVSERAIIARHEAAKGRILGAVLNLAVQVLAIYPDNELASLPRMADYAQILDAVDQVAGSAGLARYEYLAANREADAAGDDLVLTTLQRAVVGYQEVTTADLLARLNGLVDAGDRPREWPKNGRALGAHLRRQEARLAAIGFSFVGLERRATGGGKLYALEQVAVERVKESDGIVTERDGAEFRHSLRHSDSPHLTSGHDITSRNSDEVTGETPNSYLTTQLFKDPGVPSSPIPVGAGKPHHFVTPSLGAVGTCWGCGAPLPPGIDDTTYVLCRGCGNGHNPNN